MMRLSRLSQTEVFPPSRIATAWEKKIGWSRTPLGIAGSLRRKGLEPMGGVDGLNVDLIGTAINLALRAVFLLSDA